LLCDPFNTAVDEVVEMKACKDCKELDKFSEKAAEK